MRVHRLAVLAVSLVVSVAVTNGLRAQTVDLADTIEMHPQSSFFFVDLEGSARFRADLWHQLDLGLYSTTNRYGYQPSIGTDPGEVSIQGWSDFRLRIEPTVHAGERAKIMAVVDLMWTGMGQAPGSQAAGVFASDFAVPVAGGIQEPLSAAAVHMLWGELRLWHFLTIQVGRAPAQWGLGILENAGYDWDTDGGDAIDTLTFRLDITEDTVLQASLDWPLEGTQVTNAMAPWHPSVDLGDRDDIWQWRLKFERSEAINDTGAKLEWGFYGRLSFQEFSSLGGSNPYEVCMSGAPYDPVYGCQELVWRNATLFTPDAYVRLTAPVGQSLTFVAEGELAARYATMSATQRFSGKDTGKTLYGMGGVARLRLEAPTWKTSLEVGAASGDEGSEAFGILDRPVVAEPDDSTWESSPVKNNQTITSFALHPNFLTDMILYRRVIGGVTNSIYVKPTFHWDILKDPFNNLWLEASIMYARAFVASATPGDAYDLGVEGNLTLGLLAGRHVDARLQAGALLPLDAISNASAFDDPLPWTGRLLLNFYF